MGIVLLDDPPFKDEVIALRSAPGVILGLLLTPWMKWLRSVKSRIEAAAYTYGKTTLEDQNATLAATAVVVGASAGSYRVNVFLHQTVAAGVSASLQWTVRWTHDGIALSYTGANNNSNTTAVYEGVTFAIDVDGGSNVTIELAYASNPAAAAEYSLTVNVEALG